MAESRSFLGTGWDFPPAFDRGPNGVRMISDEDDIRSSLRILLSTTVGERRMQPKYGCNLQKLVFEPVDTTLTTYVKELIRTAILYFEPRIILDNVILEPIPLEGRIDIHLTYTVATTNTRYNFVYPFYRVEGTEIGK
jgi:phage baseplate assembly protein W